jgi:hypothetical protein
LNPAKTFAREPKSIAQIPSERRLPAVPLDGVGIRRV